MIIVKFFSGIGNQLYQYAIYLRLKQKYTNQEIKADLTTFEDHELLNKGNGFAYGFGLKDFFDIDIPVATIEEIKRISHEMYFGQFSRKYFPRFVKKNAGNSKLANRRARFIRRYGELRENYVTNVPFDAYTGYINELEEKRNYYVSGLWQNYEFIRPIENALRSNLKFNVRISGEVKKITEKIANSESVCVHVRRGDFISSVNKYTHDLCGYQYYDQAIKIVKSKIANPRFFVFSDDIDYCKKLFQDLSDVIYVSGNRDLSTKEEMFLISQCKSAIIPNSTFAYWGVWLTDHADKIVVAPKYSVREKNVWHTFSLPDHWNIVDNLEGC